MKQIFKNKKTKILLIITCCLSISLLGALLVLKNFLPNNYVETQEDVEDPIVEVVLPTDVFNNEIYQSVVKYQNINSDFIGFLTVGELIINEPIVKDNSEDNSEYIHKDFITGEYSMFGTSWLDFRNTIDEEDEDQNLTMYGHYVYPDYRDRDDTKLGFTNIDALRNKDLYEKNKYITFDTINGRRHYEIVALFEINENKIYENPDVIYSNTHFKNMEKYQSYIDDVELYDTGVILNKHDRLLTLQTCVENKPELRLVLVAKEIGRSN